MDTIARRKPWLAGLLQFIMPGLGNLYSGRPWRALILFLLVRVIALTLALAVLSGPGLVGIVAALALGLLVTVFVIRDGVRCARSAVPDYRLARYNRWYVYLLIFLSIAIADAVVDFQRKHIYQAMNLQSVSMEPTVLLGDHFIADKTAYLFSAPKRGDLIVYRADIFPPSVKRVVGLPGETIEIRDRVVFINGQKLDEPYVHFEQTRPALESIGDSLRPTLIPPDGYFVLGDTRDNSNDSRYWGPVSRGNVLGSARTIFYSQDPDTGKIRWDRIGMVLK